MSSNLTDNSAYMISDKDFHLLSKGLAATVTRVRLQNLICQESKMKSLKPHALLWIIIELNHLFFLTPRTSVLKCNTA